MNETEKKLAIGDVTLANGVNLITAVVMSSAGNAASSSIGGQPIDAGLIRNIVAARMQQKLSVNFGA